MKVINVGSRSFLTGDEIADAIMVCSRELWASRRVELATIPFLTDLGETRQTQFLIGWESALSTVTMPYAGAELHDGPALAELRRRMAPSVVSRIEPGDSAADEYPGSGFFDFFELEFDFGGF